MIKRVISSLIGAAITIPLILIGSVPFAIFAGLIGIIASLEMSDLLRKLNLRVHQIVATTATFFFIFLPVYIGETATAVTLALLIAYMATMLFFRKKVISRDTAATTFTAIYIGFMLGRLILLREMPLHGLYFALLIILIVWGNDIAAFMLGSKFGKHKLAPGISPNKTIEGGIGGLLVSIIIAVISSLIYKKLLFESVLIALVASVAAQLGDLFESQFKRWAKVKDSGVVVPGHGGMLDRIDGLLFAGSISYYLVLLFAKI